MAAITKITTHLDFENELWNVTCALWDHIPTAEYRKVIIGIIFLRYVSSVFEKRYNELVAEDSG